MNPLSTAPTDEMLRATCAREHPHCLACSDPADGGLGLRFQVGPDGAVHTTWNCPPGGENHPGIVPGGLIATLLDAAMAHALFAHGVAGRADDLRIRYRDPLRPGTPLTLRAWLTSGFDPLYTLEAELRQGASLCAEAEARFMRTPGVDEPAAPREPAAPAGCVRFQPIGTIRSEHQLPDETPVQPIYAAGCRGRVELRPEFAAGLDDITGFSHLYLIYHLHRAGPARLHVVPFLQDVERGVFATRAPTRPNPIGLSLVRLIAREGPVLHIENVDVVDGTPLLDLKPYAPRYDVVENPIGGWTEEVDGQAALRRGRRKWRPPSDRPVRP